MDAMKEQELKQYFFKEYTTLMNERAENQRIYDKFILERTTFNEDMKRLNEKVLLERKRLKEETMFFDKKLSILQNGFLQLDLERKKFEKEKSEYEQRRISGSYDDSYSGSSFIGDFDAGLFFAGVNNPMALRKRYRDLLKIFHPDNLAGDEAIVKAINKEYERRKNI